MDSPADLPCRVCGCTNERACEGGCHWVEKDLCSACVGKENAEIKRFSALCDEWQQMPTEKAVGAAAFFFGCLDTQILMHPEGRITKCRELLEKALIFEKEGKL